MGRRGERQHPRGLAPEEGIQDRCLPRRTVAAAAEQHLCLEPLPSAQLPDAGVPEPPVAPEPQPGLFRRGQPATAAGEDLPADAAQPGTATGRNVGLTPGTVLSCLHHHGNAGQPQKRSHAKNAIIKGKLFQLRRLQVL